MIPAYNAAAYTKRCIDSLLEHTTVPMRLIVVDNASIDTTARSSPRSRTSASFPCSRPRTGVRREDATSGSTISTGTRTMSCSSTTMSKLSANWWVPFVEALEANPDVGLVGEAGMRATWTEKGRVATEIEDEGIQPCEIIVGYSMIVRARR